MFSTNKDPNSNDESSSDNKYPPYYIISEPWEVTQLSKSIMAAATGNETPILGIDCEGLAKRRSMQLIQVYYANKSFLIDI